MSFTENKRKLSEISGLEHEGLDSQRKYMRIWNEEGYDYPIEPLQPWVQTEEERKFIAWLTLEDWDEEEVGLNDIMGKMAGLNCKRI